MALNCDVIELIQPGATGNQTYSLPADFDPKAIIIFGTPMTGALDTTAHWAYGVGFGTYRGSVVQQRWAAMRGLDAAASADTAAGQSGDAVFKILTNTAGASSVDCEIDLVSMQGGATSQVVLNWVNLHTTGSIRIFMIVLGGSDITDALAGVSSSYPTTGVNFDVTVAAGFGQPDFLMLASAQDVDQTVAASPLFTLGFGKKGQTGRSFAFTQTDGNTASIVATGQRSNKVWQKIAPGGASYEAIGQLDAVTANWPADGFRMVFDANPSFGAVVPFLALKGTFQSAVGAGAAPITGTPPVVQDLGTGFAPKLGFVMGWNLVAQTTIRSTDAELVAFGMGATDGTTEAWAGMTEDDAAGTMDSNQQQTNTKVIRNYSPVGGPTLQSEADGSFSGNNFRLSWNDIDTVAREYLYFALGDAASTSIDKAGSLVAGAAMAGGDASERAELGSVIAFARPFGADVSERAEAGALLASGSLFGAKVKEWGERAALVAGAAVLAGGDVVERSETGFLSPSARVFGADVAERAETGALLALAQLAGADASERVELGSLVSSGRLNGADVPEYAEAGALIAATVMSGVSVEEAPGKTGVVMAGTFSAGVDVSERSELGALIAGTFLTGGRLREKPRSGAVTAGGLLSGPDASERLETAYIAARGLLAGVDAATMSELGSLIAGATLSGASVKEGAGKPGTIGAGTQLSGVKAREFNESSFLAAGTFASGMKALTVTKQGVILAGGQLYGADVFIASRTGVLIGVGSISALRQKDVERAGVIMAGALLRGVWETLTGYFMQGDEVHMLTSATVEQGKITAAGPEETVIIATIPEKGKITKAGY